MGKSKTNSRNQEQEFSEILTELKSKLNKAKKWTESNFISKVKNDREAYDPEDSPTRGSNIITNDILERLLKQKYYRRVPLVFNTVEKYRSSFVDSLPDIMISPAGKDDQEKQKVIKALYQFLKQKAHLNDFLYEASEFFFNEGHVASTINYYIKTEEKPIIEETTGNPVLDREGKESTRIEVVEEYPQPELLDNTKVYYSSQSIFSTDGEKVPYFFIEKYLSKSDIRKLYNKDVQANASQSGMRAGTSINDNEEREKVIDLVTVYFYYGALYSEDNPKHDSENRKTVIFTNNEILAIEDENPHLSLGKMWGRKPNFFGYGLARRLAPIQDEISMRKEQKLRLADIAAFPKIAVKNDGKNYVDEKRISDPRAETVLLYATEPPQYLQTPQINSAVLEAERDAKEEAQETSGMFDLLGGKQQSMVKTATGQGIFAEASEKRVRSSIKRIYAFYEETVKKMLVSVQNKWSEDKIIELLDEEKNTSEEVILSQHTLKSINFDKDIVFEYESQSNNRDLVRAQAVDLYNAVSGSPVVNQKEVIKFVLDQGFGQKNPERFIKKQTSLEPGTVLIDPKTNCEFIVDNELNLVDKEQLIETNDEYKGANDNSNNSATSDSSAYVSANLRPI